MSDFGFKLLGSETLFTIWNGPYIKYTNPHAVILVRNYIRFTIL